MPEPVSRPSSPAPAPTAATAANNDPTGSASSKKLMGRSAVPLGGAARDVVITAEPLANSRVAEGLHQAAQKSSEATRTLVAQIHTVRASSDRFTARTAALSSKTESRLPRISFQDAYLYSNREETRVLNGIKAEGEGLIKRIAVAQPGDTYVQRNVQSILKQAKEGFEAGVMPKEIQIAAQEAMHYLKVYTRTCEK